MNLDHVVGPGHSSGPDEGQEGDNMALVTEISQMQAEAEVSEQAPEAGRGLEIDLSGASGRNTAFDIP